MTTSLHKKKRIQKACLVAGLLLLLGLSYAAFVLATGVFIPCPFRAVTGLLCPGCGVSHLCLALLRGDIAGAWEANPFLFCTGPIILALVGRQTWRWVQTGTRGETAGERHITMFLLVAAVVWWVVRNLPLTL